MKQVLIEAGAVYHIYNRGNNRENIFRVEDNYRYFINRASYFLKPYYDIYAYCLMPNHFHFLLRIKETTELKVPKPRFSTQALSNLFNSYTKSYNKYYTRTGSLFQEHFHRERVQTEEYFRNVFIYIQNNPVHHGFVKDAKDYEWSSWNEYLTKNSNFLNMEYPIQLFDGIETAEYLINTQKNTILDLEF